MKIIVIGLLTEKILVISSKRCVMMKFRGIFLSIFCVLGSVLSCMAGSPLDKLRESILEGDKKCLFDVVLCESVRNVNVHWIDLPCMKTTAGAVRYARLYSGHFAFLFSDGVLSGNTKIDMYFYYARVGKRFLKGQEPVVFIVSDSGGRGKRELVISHRVFGKTVQRYRRGRAERDKKGELIEFVLPSPIANIGYDWYVKIICNGKALTDYPVLLSAEDDNHRTNRGVSMSVSRGANRIVFTSNDSRVDVKYVIENKKAKNRLVGNVKVVNVSDKVQYVQLAVAFPYVEKMFRWYDGYHTKPLEFSSSRVADIASFHGPLEMLPISACMNGRDGFAIGIGADNIQSFFETQIFRSSGKYYYGFVTRLVLKPNDRRVIRLSGWHFDARLGWREAIERYWEQYPEYGKIDKRVHKGLILNGGAWVYWKYSRKVSDYIDMPRRWHVGWEWCYNPAIRIGDWSISDRYSGEYFKKNKGYYVLLGRGEKKKIKFLEEFRRIRTKQIKDFQDYGGVCAWYCEPYHAERDLIKKYFPDSLGVGKFGMYPKSRKLFGVTGVIVYPSDNSYGEFFKKSIAEIQKRYRPEAMAFDSLFGNFKHYGKLKSLETSGFDDDLDVYSYVGAGEARLAKYVRSLRTASGNEMGVVGNIKICSAWFSQLYVNHGLLETSPIRVEDVNRQNRYLRLKLMMGEKPVTFWAPIWCVHRLQPKLKELLKRYAEGKICKDDVLEYLLKARDKSLVYAYYYGAYLSPATLAGVPKLQKSMNMLERFISKGWRCSVGMIATNKSLLVSSAGTKVGRMYACGNLSDNVAESELKFIVHDSDSQYVPLRLNGETKVRFSEKRSIANVRVSIPARDTALFVNVITGRGIESARGRMFFDGEKGYELTLQIDCSDEGEISGIWIPKGFYIMRICSEKGDVNELPYRFGRGIHKLYVKGLPVVGFKCDRRALRNFRFEGSTIFCSADKVGLARKIRLFLNFYMKTYLGSETYKIPSIRNIQGKLCEIIAVGHNNGLADMTCPSVHLSKGQIGVIFIKDKTLWIVGKNKNALDVTMNKLFGVLDEIYPFYGKLRGEKGIVYVHEKTEYVSPIRQLIGPCFELKGEAEDISVSK